MNRQKLREQTNRLPRKQTNGSVIEPSRRNVQVPIQTRQVVKFEQPVVPPKEMLQTMKSVSNPSVITAFNTTAKITEAPVNKTGGCGSCQRRLGQ